MNAGPTSSSGHPFDVQVVGHLCVDLVPGLLAAADVTPGQLVETGPLDARLGGCVGNTGADLAGLGLRAVLVSSLGDDVLASTVRDLVSRIEGAEMHLNRVAASTTSYSLVVQPPDTDRTFWHHVGANAAFDGREVDVTVAPLLHVGYLPILPALTADAGEPLVVLLAAARDAGVTTSVDLCVTQVGTRSPDWTAVLTTTLPLTDVVSPSLDDVRSVLGKPEMTLAEAGDWLLARGPAVVLVTDGEHGMLLRTAPASRFWSSGAGAGGSVISRLPASWHDRSILAPTVAETVVQTTGAGDAASAGLLAAMHHGLELDDAVTLVLSAAAHRVAGRGSLSGLAHPSVPR